MELVLVDDKCVIKGKYNDDFWSLMKTFKDRKYNNKTKQYEVPASQMDELKRFIKHNNVRYFIKKQRKIGRKQMEIARHR